MKIFKYIIVFVLISVTILYGQTARVVYDLTSGDSVKIEKQLINSVRALFHYYEEEKIELKVIVVVSGDAYKYFVNDLAFSPYSEDKELAEVQKKFKHRFANLNDKGVTFNMCVTGMRSRNIDKDTLYKYVNADVMKSVYLIGAQNDGYAYLPIH